MIAPMIHHWLTRDDLGRLVAAIARLDAAEGTAAQRALERGAVDELLDTPAAREAVLGQGGAPAPVPITLLWYVPVRAALRERGEADVQMADFAATVPVLFLASRRHRALARGDAGIASWWRSIAALPDGTVAQAEQAADTGALALWWAGCFPEWVSRKTGGRGMLRAYVTFATHAFALAARLLGHRGAGGELYARAAERAKLLRAVLASTRREFIGSDAHSADGRLDRFLERMEGRAPRDTLGN